MLELELETSGVVMAQIVLDESVRFTYRDDLGRTVHFLRVADGLVIHIDGEDVSRSQAVVIDPESIEIVLGAARRVAGFGVQA